MLPTMVSRNDFEVDRTILSKPVGAMAANDGMSSEANEETASASSLLPTNPR